MKKSNKKKILGIMSKIGNFINNSQPIVGDMPPKKDPEENQPKKEEVKVKKEVKNFNLQIEDDGKAEYDLNDDDDDEEEEEEEDDDNEEKDKKNKNENNEESTNDNDSSNEKKEEENKTEIKQENNEEKKIEKENKNEDKKEKVEIKEEKKEEKKENKEEIKESKKPEINPEANKQKEESKEIKSEKKEESIKKKENIQKPKNVNKPASKTSHPKPVQIIVENESKQNINESPSITKDKSKLKFQKKQKASDKNKICHYFLKKGTDIDIKEFDFYTIKKVKKQKSMFSKLNNLGINLNLNIKFGGINKVSNKINSFFKKKPKDIKYTDYYLIINDQFLYFCKDIELFTDEPDKKRIGSIVPFNNITKIEINKEGNMHKISFEIQFRTLNKIKEFYADDEIYGELLEIFHEFKKEYNLDYSIEIKGNK
jgi:chemotaxis protein histidine kinase CheA